MKRMFAIMFVVALAFSMVGCASDPAARHTQILSNINAWSPIIGKELYVYGTPEIKASLTAVCALKEVASMASDDAAAKAVYAQLNQAFKDLWVKASTIKNDQVQNAVLLINMLSEKLATVSTLSGYLLEDVNASVDGVCAGVSMGQALANKTGYSLYSQTGLVPDIPLWRE